MSTRKKIAEVIGRTPIWRIAELFQKSPRVLFYHGVMNTPIIEKHVQANQISYSDFEEQMAFLKCHFHFVSIEELHDSFKSGKHLTAKDVVLTFDDGYRNNLTVAAPLLKKMNIPFAVFVSTGCVDDGRRVPTYYVRSAVFEKEIEELDIPTLKKHFSLDSIESREECCDELINVVKTQEQYIVRNILNDIESNVNSDLRKKIDAKYESESLLTWDEVRELRNYGAIIGSHTIDHAVLHSNQSAEETNNQLNGGKTMIENKVGKCDYFAFPNGDASSICQFSLELAGNIYPMSFIVDGKSVNYDTDMNAVSRIGMCDGFGAARSLFSLLSLK